MTLEIDEATMALWPQALKNYGHPWREGQRCDTQDGSCGHSNTKFGGISTPIIRALISHDIPMPSPTKELLWDMVVKLASLRDELDGPYFIATSYDPAEDVIRAWASMGAT